MLLHTARRWPRRPLTALAVALALLASCGEKPDLPPAMQRPLRIIIGGDIASPDPQLRFDSVSWTILRNIYQSLVRFDRSLRPAPELAARWVNPDEETWRFFLDPAARFSDGSPVLASDVRFSIERLKDLRDSELRQFARHISRVEVVDERTVDVHTSGPKAILNSLAFIPILSERQIEAAGEGLSELPMGSGPYRVVDREEGRSLTLAVNEHHAARPAVRDVVFEIYEGEEQLRQIVESKPDLALLLGQTTLEGMEQQAVPGLQLVSFRGLSVFYATLNMRPSFPDGRPNPLSDVRVRRALALATNQDDFVREILMGRGRTVSQLVVPEVFGFDPGVPPPAHDPAAARALLAEAGHEALEITILGLEASSPRIPELLIEQWSHAGIRASVEIRTPEEYQRAQEQGSFHLTIEGWACSSADASEVLDFLLRGRDEVQGLGLTNHTGFSIPELNQIVDSNLGILDPQERLSALQRGLRIAAERGPYLPLFVQDDVYLISDELPWRPRVDGELRIEEMQLGPTSRSEAPN